MQIIRNNDGRIILSPDLLNRLKIAASSFYYTMFSDTEEKYLKILFFDSKQKVAFIDILHQDVFGAISKFTEIIYKNKNFNILASYNSHQQIKNNTPFAHWFALIDITANSDEFFIDTLRLLKDCTYGEYNDLRKVSEVFLIEANISNIPSDSVLWFGQNKKTKEGDQTSVSIKKRELLLEKLKDYTFKAFIKRPNLFAARYGLHETNSLTRLAHQIIKENVPKKRKIIIKAISWGIPVFIVFVSTILFEPVKKQVFELFHHYVSLSILVAILVSRKYIEKALKGEEEI